MLEMARPYPQDRPAANEVLKRVKQLLLAGDGGGGGDTSQSTWTGDRGTASSSLTTPAQRRPQSPYVSSGPAGSLAPNTNTTETESFQYGKNNEETPATPDEKDGATASQLLPPPLPPPTQHL